jgi:hypothetical protein
VGGLPRSVAESRADLKVRLYVSRLKVRLYVSRLKVRL